MLSEFLNLAHDLYDRDCGKRTLWTLRRLLAQLQNAHVTGTVKGAHEDVVITTAKTKKCK